MKLWALLYCEKKTSKYSAASRAVRGAWLVACREHPREVDSLGLDWRKVTSIAVGA